jgi:hypothetical protein
MGDVVDKNNLRQELQQIFDNFDVNSKRIQKLVNEKYFDEAIILTVVIFEVLLKDTFRSSRDVWIHFGHGSDIVGDTQNHMISNKIIATRKHIRKYLESINAYDKFLKNYYIFKDDYPFPENETLYQTLFTTKDTTTKCLINFQNIKDENGACHAYKFFLDIDLKRLDPDEKKSKEKWAKLTELIDQRHKIVHSGSNTTMKSKDIQEVLDSLIFMKDSIRKKIFSYYGIH